MDKSSIEEFSSFCALDCNRRAFISAYLETRHLPHSIIPITDSQFILIRYNNSCYYNTFYLKTVFAHYDRARGTQGANDNSAAVFELLRFAEQLNHYKGTHNIQIIFTDHEEADVTNSLKENLRKQGSYKLGGILKQKGIKNCLFINFDMCGIGDTIILSQATEKLLESRKKTKNQLYTQLGVMRNYIIDILLSTNEGKFLNMRTPFSDNLGLILQGYPALQISLLPFTEALTYQLNLKHLSADIDVYGHKVNKKMLDIFKKKYEQIQPLSWQTRHSTNDSVDRLTWQSFDIINGLLTRLIDLNIPV